MSERKSDVGWRQHAFWVVLGAAGLVPLVIRCSALRAAGERYTVKELKPGVFVWLPEDIIEQDGDPEFSRAANAGFIVAPDGVIVVDTTNTPFHGRELLYEIRHHTDRPVKAVVDMSASPDEVLGNEVFLDLQAPIIATAEVAREIEQYQRDLSMRLRGDDKLEQRMRGVHIRFPDRTFSGEMTLEGGGQPVKLISLATGTSEREAAVYLPAARVAFLGDIFENGYFPRLGRREVHQWTNVLRQVEHWDVEYFVPAHGDPAGKAELVAFRQFLEWLTREVETRVGAHESEAEVKRELDSLPNYHWHAPERAGQLVRDVYRQTSGTSH